MLLVPTLSSVWRSWSPLYPSTSSDFATVSTFFSRHLLSLDRIEEQLAVSTPGMWIRIRIHFGSRSWGFQKGKLKFYNIIFFVFSRLNYRYCNKKNSHSYLTLSMNQSETPETACCFANLFTRGRWILMLGNAKARSAWYKVATKTKPSKTHYKLTHKWHQKWCATQRTHMQLRLSVGDLQEPHLESSETYNVPISVAPITKELDKRLTKKATSRYDQP